MHDIVKDISFDIDKSYEYILSIQVSLDGFSFSVVDPNANKVLAFEETTLQISDESLIARRFSEWVNSVSVLQNPFKKIRIIVFNDQFTLVPSKYASKELKREIPHLLFTENTKVDLAENVIKHLESRLIFALPQGLMGVIQKLIGECQIIHPVKVIANQLTKKEKSVVLIFDKRNFYINVFSKNKIVMANSFKIGHTNDVLYYVLSGLKQLNIDPKITDILYTGKIIQEDETLLVLKKHFNSVKSLPLPETLKFDAELNNYPVHQSLSLYL